ncbi:hypothetical protein CMQ_6403 [Grosmannia clavigera kw1407]|uniref:TeaA receptor TeaR n=1 Tax=Grosmannia clavigera (strain kw1407 / UAMH 11150) TaxID=655863 RepID=F0XMF8_GROCL|nr:uncharacterized protein CMQ_6403 [Grosmannia clavigera kw1407]EFX01461.1 hypothetical protein CMQ_6403 [Grosmannia clavigera kw1407]
MAVVSSAPITTAANATALTPPHSSHGNEYTWDASSQHVDSSMFAPNGGTYYASTNDLTAYDASEKGVFGGEPLLRQQTAPSSTHLSESVPLGAARDGQKGLDDSPMERPKITQTASVNDVSKKAATKEQHSSDPDDVSSKWIHRDKLARIESEELQAAGIILPKSRARSRPRRDASVDKANGHRSTGPETDIPMESRSRRSSVFNELKPHDASRPSWDLRRPDEIDDAAYFVPTNGTKGLSRIPVAKQSPAPIPLEHIERDSMLARKRGNSIGAEESIGLKSRSRSNSIGRALDGGTGSSTEPPSQRNASRSVSEASPKKLATNGSANAGGGRKPTTSKTNSTSRPKTRNGIGKDTNGSAAGGAARPTTRSGERELSGAAHKRPEGEPPWMINAYRPDPRLPPDQQLLPTVARRLQQEKWEREGKFGNIYDKEFRPLTENGFLTPPEPSNSASAAAETSTATGEATGEVTGETTGEATGEAGHWPLKIEAKNPASPIGRSGSYSTIPKIQDQPGLSPLPSPLGPTTHISASGPKPAQTASAAAATQDEDDAKGGCGCCVVM